MVIGERDKLCKFVVMKVVVSRSYSPCSKPSAGYLFSLWGFMLLFVVALSMLMMPLLELLLSGSYVKYVAMIVQGLLVFALPAWLVEQYYRRSHREQVWRLRWSDARYDHLPRLVALMLAAMCASLLLESAMSLFPVPKIFASMEEQMTLEYEALLGEQRLIGRILIYIATIVAAPLGEELFFRGGVQGWLLCRLRNPHVAVWVTALLFSAMHMQWSGFPSRLLLGGVIGYVALYRGLWVAILFHVVNNAMTFVLESFDLELGLGWGFAVMLVLVGLLVKEMKQETSATSSINDLKDEE